MGDRENPIKFGPEWLRNLARERGTGNTGSLGTSNTGPGPGGPGGVSPNARRGGGDPIPGNVASNSSSANGTLGVRVHLANLRYGREEMLALYEAAADPPQELTSNELLYQARSKQPFALSTTFEDEMRESARAREGAREGSERFGAGRGRGAPPPPDATRPRFRTTGAALPARPRNLTTGEAHFSGNSPDPSVRPQLAQRTPRYQSNPEHKPLFYPNYVGANPFRSKRQTNTSSTNWRSPQAREPGDEWRSEPGRPRPGQDRERDRERPGPSSNRRSSDHEETIPEWAFANAEACGGTFDSSGAFHGYSNDDSNLPKNQDNGYSLARSRTHNSLSRSKTVEEGSEEWWASEKAKKLSPKRFDAGDIKFKQGTGIQDGPLAPNLKSNPSTEEHFEEPRKELSSDEEEQVKDTGDFGDNSYHKKQGYKQQLNESKAFESMMRQDMNLEEAHSSGEQRGNFQSVMIPPNNSLRQKHQNIGAAPLDAAAAAAAAALSRPPPHMPTKYSAHTDKELPTKHQTFEDKMLDDFLDLTLETEDLGASVLMGPSSGGGMASGIANSSLPQLQDRGLHQGLQNSSLQNQGLSMSNVQNMSSLGAQGSGLNQGVSSLLSPQLEFGSKLGMGLPAAPGGLGQRAASSLPIFQNATMPGMPNQNVANSSLFMGNSSNASGDIPMPGHGGGSLFGLHGRAAPGAQGTFSASVFNNMMHPPPPAAPPLQEQWYYEDPEKNVQGPFSSREMYNWYRAGFFTPSLMVRRACEREMRPLGSYGPLVPFVQLDVLPPFPMSGFESRPAATSQPGMGLGVMPISNNELPIPMPPSAQNNMQNSFQNMQAAPMSPLRNPILAPPMQLIHNTVVGPNVLVKMPPPHVRGPQSGAHPPPPAFDRHRTPSVPQHPQHRNVFDSLWGQAGPDALWMQRNPPPPIENRVNNLPLYFWDQQPTALTANQLLPEGITKEMKTEEQILAQLRASQGMSPAASAGAHKPEPKPAASAGGAKPMDAFTSPITATYLDLHKIIHKDMLPAAPAPAADPNADRSEQPPKRENSNKVEESTSDVNNTKSQQNMTKTETKPTKPSKEGEKSVKVKESSNATKSKSKKKEEKRDEPGDAKAKCDDGAAPEKRSVESSPVKSKKEEKSSKKDLDKEKKEWIKEGFTIVKGPEKSAAKENKKKAEASKPAEPAEKHKKEAAASASLFVSPPPPPDDKRKQEDPAKKQGGLGAVRKAAWSAAGGASEAPTLAEIQRLEREKKLEQIRDQQQVMHALAQQHAAQLAREQEMQANLAWAKRNANIGPPISPSLAEIQAQEQVSRKMAPCVDERPLGPLGPPHPGGFWESSAYAKNLEGKAQEQKLPEPKAQEVREPESKNDVKGKKKLSSAPSAAAPTPAPAPTPPKKPASPAAEFEMWCSTTLKSWSSKIDVPTFIGFLRDIESPYEVKDYVRCYLGDTKDSGDFARNFLERRSKLLRVGMVTPSDDLCSPALAVNPRNNSQSDYQEVKGKGKKVKKNKMLKVDARFLGFSATAAEDRINVGDIDTA